MIAAVHLSLRTTIPLALVVVVLLSWYWSALGSEIVPVRRRRVRRISMVIMFASIPAFVLGLSVFDPARDPIPYVVVWLLAIACVLLVVLSAVLDVAVSIQIQRERYERDLRNAASELRDAVDSRADHAGHSSSRAAEPTGDRVERDS
jgi:hypothetical protein